MKRILFIVALTLVNVAAYCQIGVKDGKYYTSCTYDRAYLKSDNTGIISFEDFEISYKKETKEYIIEAFIDRGTIYTFNLKYDRTVKEGADIAYFYKGVRSNFMDEPVVVFTRTKLSAYTKNTGFKSLDDIEDFDKQAIGFIFPKSYLVFSVAPIKNTQEAHEAKVERKQREEAKRIAQEKAKNALEKLLPIGQKSLEDSVRQEAIVEFFNNKGEVGSNTYIAVIDTALQVTIIKKNDDIRNEALHNEWLKDKPEYEGYNSYDGKVINGKVFFSDNFNFDNYIEIQEHECSVRYDKKHDSYIYYKEPYRSNLFDESNQMEDPKEIKEIIENNIKKKGMYSLFWKTLDGKLVSISYIKHGIMEGNYKTELYSIYK